MLSCAICKQSHSTFLFDINDTLSPVYWLLQTVSGIVQIESKQA